MLLYQNSETFNQYHFIVVDINVTSSNFQLEIADDDKKVKSVLSIPVEEIQAKSKDQADKDLIGSRVQSFSANSTSVVYGNRYIQADIIQLKDAKDNPIILMRGGQ